MSNKRVDPSDQVPGRSDPEDGEVDSTLRISDGQVVKNQDPRRHYVWVAKTQLSLMEYRNLGYKQEVRRADGPQVASAETEDAFDGSHIEYMGHVLMSIDKGVKARRDLKGADGWGLGQEHFDRLEKQIIQNGGVDVMRGQHGLARGIHLNPETSGLQREG